SVSHLLLARSFGASHNLLSFPTRRSSDLLVDVSSVFGRGNRAAVGEKDDVFAHRARAADDSLDALHRFVHRDHRPLYADASAHRDRKSTRLNSSHVEISYAVFCLKKKKERVGCRGLMSSKGKELDH